VSSSTTSSEYIALLGICYCSFSRVQSSVVVSAVLILFTKLLLKQSASQLINCHYKTEKSKYRRSLVRRAEENSLVYTDSDLVPRHRWHRSVRSAVNHSLRHSSKNLSALEQQNTGNENFIITTTSFQNAKNESIMEYLTVLSRVTGKWYVRQKKPKNNWF